MRVVLVDAARGRTVGAAQFWESAGETIRTPALVAHRRGAVAYTTEDGVFLLHRRRNLPLDRQPEIALASLTRTARGFRWVRAGRAPRFAIGTPFGPPARCSTPPAANVMARAGHSLVFALGEGDDDQSGGRVYGCVEGGPVHRLAAFHAVESYAASGASLRVLNGPMALLESGRHDKYGASETLTSYDLRTGAEVVSAVAGYSGDRYSFETPRAVLARSGAVAWSKVHHEDGPGGEEEIRRTIWIADASGPRTIDEGDAVDADSLRLEGTTLSWRHGDAWRSAELP